MWLNFHFAFLDFPVEDNNEERKLEDENFNRGKMDGSIEELFAVMLWEVRGNRKRKWAS